jgi:hypothetical protein
MSTMLAVVEFLCLGSFFRSSVISVIQESKRSKILHRSQSEREALYGFLRAPGKSSFKRLLRQTPLWQQYVMSSTKSSEGLKDSECEKGQLAIWPPISYVPPTDLHVSTESETIKVKLPDATAISVKAFASGNNKEYTLH